jgi:hypothetical protein
MILDMDNKHFSYFISKDFPEYRDFHISLKNTFEKLPWDNSKFSSNAKKILEVIFSKYLPDTVGEGGKIFTGLLFQTLSDRKEIDSAFIKKYSDNMRSFDIEVPPIQDESLFHSAKFRWYIVGYAAFATGILLGLLFAWFSNQILYWVLITGIIIVILVLGYFIYKRKFRQNGVRKHL